MSKKGIFGIVGVVLLVAIGAGAYYVMSMFQPAITWDESDLASEKISRDGDVWNMEFESVFDSPIDAVYDAWTHPERSHEFNPERVISSKLKSEQGNKKLVEIATRILNLPIQRLVIEYTFYPEEKRIESRTVNFNLADITSTYRFEPSPDGKKTLLRFKQESKQKLGNPLPESVQKNALKESYVMSVQTAKNALRTPGSS